MSLEISESNRFTRRQPFVYLAAALAAGILIDLTLRPATFIPAAGAIIVSLVLAFFVRHQPRFAAVSLLICVSIAGALVSRAERAAKDASDLRRVYDSALITGHDAIEITGVLVQPPEPAPAAYSLYLETESIRYSTDTKNAIGHVKLLVETPDAHSQSYLEGLRLEYGSRARILARVEQQRSYGNPGSPDFNEFLERKGYDLAGRVKSPLLIENLGFARANPALRLLYRLRIRLIKTIDERFKEPRLSGVLKAMLAGNRNFVDEETARRLREGGTFHTLVIAGLHVGVIAWALLAWRRLRRMTSWVLLSLIVLWSYVAMVGMAGPAVRATIMISVGLIGPLLFRRAVSFNTVALAAFIMLVWKPSLIGDPGFQLSFAAVAGIVALAAPLLEKLRETGEWRPNSRSPHPPSSSRWITSLAEILFWDQRRFDRDMASSLVRYSLEKSRTALLLNKMRIQGLFRAIVVLLITSAAIQIATAPLMILYFNRLSPVGVLLNVTAGLLTAALMLTGYAAILVGFLSSFLASQLAVLGSVAGRLLVNSVVPFLGYSLATLRVPQYEGSYRVIYLLYYVPLGMIAGLTAGWRPVKAVPYLRNDPRPDRRAAGRQRGKIPGAASGRRMRIAGAIAFLAAFAAVMRPVESIPRGNLTVYFLDVGQGDSALIVFPGGRTMLVDGGGEIRFDHAQPVLRESEAPEPDYVSSTDDASIEQNSRVGEEVVSRFLWSLGLRRIDYVVATHSHQDHVGGLFNVIDNFKVGELLLGRAPLSDIEYSRLTRAASRRGVPVGSVAAGDRFDLDGVTVEVPWPARPRPTPVINGNNESIVLRLSLGTVSILMAGDIEREAEEEMVRSGAALKADLLKAPHHGSRTSSSSALLNAVSPKFAVVSVGEQSRFGHPHSEVLSRYLNRGVSLYRTGRSGMITARTDGNTLSIQTFRH